MPSELITAKTRAGRFMESIGRRLKWFDTPTMEQI
jgi:hypothetical protein